MGVLRGTEANVDEWIGARPEPEWLRAARRRAWRAYQEQPDPYWDRTEIRPFDPAGRAPAGATVRVEPLPEAAARRGVVLCDMATALRDHADKVHAHLGRLLPDERGKFEALHNAVWSAGAFLFVPDGVEVEEPLQVTLQASDGRVLGGLHTLAVLGRDAGASLVQRAAGAAEAQVLPAVEASLAAGARLRFADVQNFATSAHTYTARRGWLARDAHLEWIIGEVGSRVVRGYTESVLHEVGGESESLLVFFGAGRQHMDMALTMVHHGPRTLANMLAKGVLRDRARSVYRGTSDIKAGSKDSNSQQSAKTLHLGSEVRSDSIPALFIDEYQLSAGHAATVGKVDDEQLFYMRSRGLPEVEALRLIVQGFFAPLLDRIPVAAAREELAALLDGKLGGQG